MKAHSMWIRTLLILSATLLLMGGPITAQEEEEDAIDGLGTWYVEVGAWIAQPTGLGLTPAYKTNPLDAFDTRPFSITPTTDTRFRYRGGFEFKNDIGEIILTWYSHQDRSELSGATPGQFLFGESLVTPLYSGVFYDGLADSFDSESFIKTRDIRLDFSRNAFSNSRIKGKWFVGYRRVSHHRRLSADYHAAVPHLPPILPPLSDPRHDLDPVSDTARMASDVTVRGGEAGLEVTMPLLGKKVWLEAGMSIAVMRGRATTEYYGTTHRYIMTDGSGGFLYVLAPPFDEFGVDTDPADPNRGALVDDILQQELQFGTRSTNESVSSQALEMFLGIRYKAWKDMEVFAGYRSARFTNMGVELRQMDVVPVILDPEMGEEPVFNVGPPTTIYHDLNYEGYYAGVAYSF